MYICFCQNTGASEERDDKNCFMHMFLFGQWPVGTAMNRDVKISNIRCGREDGKIGVEKCAFCGKNIDEVEKLIKAPNSNVCICDVCARIVF